MNLTIKRRMRAGLVGPNGIGKTTLLRIMLGQDFPDEGSVQKEKGVTIGYLAQDIIVGSDRSILEEVLAGYPEIRRLEGLILYLSTKIADHPGDERLLKQLGDAQERFEVIGGWSLEDRGKKYWVDLDLRTLNLMNLWKYSAAVGGCE